MSDPPRLKPADIPIDAIERATVWGRKQGFQQAIEAACAAIEQAARENALPGGTWRPMVNRVKALLEGQS